MMINNNSLEVNLCGIKLPNPVMLPAGVIGTTSGGLKRASKAGAGGVVTKSLGLTPRKGHSSPDVVEVSAGYLNAMGLPNPGVKEFVDELDKEEKIGVPVFGSIYGGSSDEFRQGAELLAPKVDAIELNLSCPHSENLGSEIGSDPSNVKEITDKVNRAVHVPVFAKLTPNVTDITELGRAAEEGGADGVVAINTLEGMAIDIETKKPILGNKSGGLSGPALHPVAVKSVYDLYESLSIPIIGVGGVSTVNDLLELALAGAQVVQVGAAVAKQGLTVFQKLNSSLNDHLVTNEVSFSELVGKAH